MPAKPRSPTQGRSPVTNALRSIPALKPSPAPVRTPTARSPSASSLSRAAATPSASARLIALRASGRLSVISRTLPRRSVRTGAAWAISVSALMTAGPYRPPPQSRDRSLGGEQGQVRLALAAQDTETDLDADDAARLGEHARLRLDDLRRQHAAALRHRGVEPDALEVAAQLLDGVDGRHALDLHCDPAIGLVAAHEVHGPDVGRPFPADEPEAFAAEGGRVCERLLDVALDAVLLERGRVGGWTHVMRDVREDLEHADVEPVLRRARSLAHHDPLERIALLLHDRRRRHPVLGLVPARVGVDHHRAVRLDHDQPQCLWQQRVEAARVTDLATGDDEAHRSAPYDPGRTARRPALKARRRARR